MNVCVLWLIKSQGTFHSPRISIDHQLTMLSETQTHRKKEKKQKETKEEEQDEQVKLLPETRSLFFIFSLLLQSVK